ncbi:MAG TPA: SRPBCC family protein [Micromonosporaceae bacterium]|nr:SRPBCC family protein [Micromonosporaceae bacterium]
MSKRSRQVGEAANGRMRFTGILGGAPPGKSMAALVGAASLLAAAWLTRLARRRTLDVRASVTVNRSSADAYRFWRNLENLPRFMGHIVSIQAIGDGRSHWVVRGPAGRRVQWVAQIVDDRPQELISWRSLPGAKVPNSGVVRFAPAPGGRGTEVRVELSYTLRAGAAGRAIAKLFGEEPEQQVRDDLRRFKQVLETGEVVRSDGSPGGISVRQQVLQRPARPMTSALGR